MDYDLTIEALPVGECTRDRFEGFLGNDEQERAAKIDEGQYVHNVCGDEDWFAIELIAGLELKVDAFPEVALSDWK